MNERSNRRWKKKKNRKEKISKEKILEQIVFHFVRYDENITPKMQFTNLHRMWPIFLLSLIMKGYGYYDWYVSCLGSTTLDWTGRVGRHWIGRHSRLDFDVDPKRKKKKNWSIGSDTLHRLRNKLKCLSLITIFKRVILDREGNSSPKESISFSSVFSLFVSFSFSHWGLSFFRHSFETDWRTF